MTRKPRREIVHQSAPPTIRVKPHSYQPSKAELEEPIRINATPKQLAKFAVTPVRIVEDPDA